MAVDKARTSANKLKNQSAYRCNYDAAKENWEGGCSPDLWCGEEEKCLKKEECCPDDDAECKTKTENKEKYKAK